MANQLSMADIHSIETLHRSGHSNRKIAQLLGIDRGSVAKYVRQIQNQPDHPSGGAPPPGSEAAAAHPPGPISTCESFHDAILARIIHK